MDKYRLVKTRDMASQGKNWYCPLAKTRLGTQGTPTTFPNRKGDV